jgi:hypothetical protein
MYSFLDFLPLPFDLGVEEEGVPGLVETVGNRPTNSSKEIEPPFGGTTLGTRKSKAKEELKDNQKQKYQPIGQNFKLTKNNNTPERGKACLLIAKYSR